MPQWLRVFLGVATLVTVSAWPGLYFEWRWLQQLQQPHPTQAQRSPTENRPTNANSHNNNSQGIHSQAPPPESAASSSKSQAPNLQESSSEDRRTDLGNENRSMYDLSAWATVAVTVGLLIVAVVQARIYRNQAS